MVFGDADNDTLFGEEGKDVLIGGEGDDSLLGGNGDDRLFGEAGNDRIFGGDSVDTILGSAGDDVIRGEAGLDRFVFDASEAGNNTLVDFEAGETVYLDNLGFADEAAAASSFVAQGSDVVFTSGAVAIKFLDANLSDVLDAIVVRGSAMAPMAVQSAAPIDDAPAFAFVSNGYEQAFLSAEKVSFENTALADVRAGVTVDGGASPAAANAIQGTPELVRLDAMDGFDFSGLSEISPEGDDLAWMADGAGPELASNARTGWGLDHFDQGGKADDMVDTLEDWIGVFQPENAFMV